MAQLRVAKFEDAEQIANIHIQSWKSTYKDLIDEQDLSNITLENRVALWETILKSPINGQIAYVIENDDGQVVGFVSGGKERTKKYSYDGEIYAIYMLDNYQRMGYGSMLLSTFAKAMKEVGYESLLVWVLTRNPSAKFYKILGAKPVEAEEVTIGQGTYEETAYGWEDINELIEKL
ncbi:N-acetyltransferase [Halobacillus andaensis]|uniref:N-acetyltransferase n=1 Tax=Halobacillus andaensis TaxID=1176239 RepID=A0A917B2V7_HALAA|nr:GNAT family N-acetyltransferase [Halobacillus andaensis]MBP2004162.1 GNAT superfamily N-acetyltransferase [Halobacillus andaensis]GGF16275.1 N-acetyltransferase [Halobacillus andaensis]